MAFINCAKGVTSKPVTYYSLKNFPKFSPIIVLCFAYYSKIILRRYSCIGNTSFKIVESNEVKSLVLAANCKTRYNMTALLKFLSLLLEYIDLS